MMFCAPNTSPGSVKLPTAALSLSTSEAAMTAASVSSSVSAAGAQASRSIRGPEQPCMEYT